MAQVLLASSNSQSLTALHLLWALAMQQTTSTSPGDGDIPPRALAFYRDVLNCLNKASLPYLVGGSYALNHYTGVTRRSADFDVYIPRADYGRISRALAQAGYSTELSYPHWLAKIRSGGDVIDLVFNSGNGITEVDEAWFDFSVPAKVFGVEANICPAEELLWSKAYIMERERFDGADVAHLLLAQGQQLDWSRLLRRFDQHWRLLLSHLILFGFIYPGHRRMVPRWVMDELLGRLEGEVEQDLRGVPSPDEEICNGTLLSREQYLNDIDHWGCLDARLKPRGNMTRQDTASWTEAIKDKR